MIGHVAYDPPRARSRSATPRCGRRGAPCAATRPTGSRTRRYAATGSSRLRRFERDGRVYERVLRIKAWKDAPPRGRARCSAVASRSGASFGTTVRTSSSFARETRRAERAHWAIVALSPVFFAWNPWWLATAMVGYGVVANVPCLLVQRYNRARLVRLLGPHPTWVARA